MPAPPAAAPPTHPGGAPAAGPRARFHARSDVNGDGRNDVVTAAGHDYGVFWFEQSEDGQWTRRTIDNAWSQGHASTLIDLNGDGRKDFVTGKRFMAHNGSDPGEREPLGLYWYESAAGGGGAEWIRHIVDFGGRIGGPHCRSPSSMSTATGISISSALERADSFFVGEPDEAEAVGVRS